TVLNDIRATRGDNDTEDAYLTQIRATFVSRVKLLAGFGSRESWGSAGRPGPGAPPGAGSRRSPRAVARCCTRPGSRRRARRGTGRRRSLRGRAARTSGSRTRVRVTRSARAYAPGCARAAARGG